MDLSYGLLIFEPRRQVPLTDFSLSEISFDEDNAADSIVSPLTPLTMMQEIPLLHTHWPN